MRLPRYLCVGISLKPARLRRYRDIARLLLKYGGGEAVRQAGLEDALDGAGSVEASRAAKGESLAGDLERLGPTFIKLGQVLSTRQDLLPRAYTDALARLQDKVAPFPYEIVEETIKDELGIRVSKAFAEFDARPLASASLGQVHRAVMHDGRIVAVKIQRPGIRARIEEDLSA
ncbi:MAG TPA: AarF/UbiB family protein, partial [Gaiellales bacterium]|nr:AarF/UbiB family protein [Gaiellales bacterium]